MLPYTLDSHFSYGYGDGLFNHRERDSKDPRFWVKYSRCSREPMSFPEECKHVARLLATEAEKLGRIPVVCLSGGLDSEIVLRSFHAADVPFKVMSYRYHFKLNDHELSRAREVCQELKLKLECYDIPILTWIGGAEARELYHESFSFGVGNLPHMKLIDTIWERGGLPVLGNGDVYLEPRDGAWEYVELEYMLAWYRHCIERKILGGIGFFQHTPEITLAMVREPEIERLGTDTAAAKIFKNSRQFKYLTYHKHWPGIVKRAKYTGNENVLELFTKTSTELIGDRTAEELCVQKARFTLPEFRAMLEPTAQSSSVIQS